MRYFPCDGQKWYTFLLFLGSKSNRKDKEFVYNLLTICRYLNACCMGAKTKFAFPNFRGQEKRNFNMRLSIFLTLFYLQEVD